MEKLTRKKIENKIEILTKVKLIIIKLYIFSIKKKHILIKDF